ALPEARTAATSPAPGAPIRGAPPAHRATRRPKNRGIARVAPSPRTRDLQNGASVRPSARPPYRPSHSPPPRLIRSLQRRMDPARLGGLRARLKALCRLVHGFVGPLRAFLDGSLVEPFQRESSHRGLPQHVAEEVFPASARRLGERLHHVAELPLKLLTDLVV